MFQSDPVGEEQTNGFNPSERDCFFPVSADARNQEMFLAANFSPIFTFRSFKMPIMYISRKI